MLPGIIIALLENIEFVDIVTVVNGYQLLLLIKINYLKYGRLHLPTFNQGLNNITNKIMWSNNLKQYVKQLLCLRLTRNWW